MTAPIFVLICFWRASGLAFLLSLNILLTRDYCILTRVEIFHIIAIFFFFFFFFNSQHQVEISTRD